MTMMHVSVECVVHSLAEGVRDCCTGRPSAVVERIGREISYEDFHTNFLAANKPCIFGKWATSDWKSVKFWATGSDEADCCSPNFDYLVETFGHARVPVANCGQKYYNSQEKHEQAFCDYVDYWKKYRVDSTGSPCLYLKDWHFNRQFTDYEAYKVPVYFQNDWLNEYWDVTTNSRGDDYRFVYMGPKGSWTPFHADVYRSYSWSANICGRKKWILYPPGEEEKLKDRDGDLPYDVTLTESDAHSVTVIQEPGEIIFVPSGWHHQVHNLEDTISINHNWVNACNIGIMWEYVCSELESVKNEIQDCRCTMTSSEWHQHCQVMMRALCGIDFTEFLCMMKTIATPRLCLVCKVASDPSNAEETCSGCRDSSEKFTKNVDLLRRALDGFMGKVKLDSSLKLDFSTDFDKLKHGGEFCYFQAIFDLCKIVGVLEKFSTDPDVVSCSQEQKTLCDDASDLLQRIYICLQNLKYSFEGAGYAFCTGVVGTISRVCMVRWKLYGGVVDKGSSAISDCRRPLRM